ncbi:MAG: hypothetical protein LUF25_06140 [Phascolarctobacterium sp.]|nr:hypothetical protein [Phascolarctobacterium sp.]
MEWKAEKICRWGAARAGVIVVAPLVGTMPLMANEVYMITRLGELRRVRLDEGTVLRFLGPLGATFVGQTMATFIPFAPLQIPLAISVTYVVGKVANAWLKAGRPEDIAVFCEAYEKTRRESMKDYEKIKNMGCKDEPLGDESRRFDIDIIREGIAGLSASLDTVFSKIIGQADLFEAGIAAGIRGLRKAMVPSKECGGRWA